VTSLSRRQCVLDALALAGLGLLSGCGLMPASGSQTNPVPRVGCLSPSNGPDSRELNALRQGLRLLGYEGQNISREPRVANGNNEQLRSLASELVSLGVDVLVTDGFRAVAAWSPISAARVGT
jgi:hypothetical protein